MIENDVDGAKECCPFARFCHIYPRKGWFRFEDIEKFKKIAEQDFQTGARPATMAQGALFPE